MTLGDRLTANASGVVSMLAIMVFAVVPAVDALAQWSVKHG